MLFGFVLSLAYIFSIVLLGGRGKRAIAIYQQDGVL